jgi:hypothetical protein
MPISAAIMRGGTVIRFDTKIQTPSSSSETTIGTSFQI